GRIAHGSMPYLGINAIDGMSHLLDLVRDELGPALAGRITAMPVVPEGSRYATININGIDGGQPVDDPPRACVAPTRAAPCSIAGSCSKKDWRRRAPRSAHWCRRRRRACRR